MGRIPMHGNGNHLSFHEGHAGEHDRQEALLGVLGVSYDGVRAEMDRHHFRPRRGHGSVSPVHPASSTPGRNHCRISNTADPQTSDL